MRRAALDLTASALALMAAGCGADSAPALDPPVAHPPPGWDAPIALQPALDHNA